ncbi:MAG: ribosome biogenesis GTPase YlqF [Defluviitaleaceae bacterium]|nr:ribosome biogenesis GTPase YlqF [Defluviitaleaceae bacterium]
MDIQWYPGHMTKTKRMLLTQMGLIDVVIELLDARIPLSSRNPDIDTIAKDKKRVLLLNKADLASENITARWEEHFRQMGFFTLPVNAKDNKKTGGTAKLAALLKEIMRPKVESQKKRGRINAPIRAMIVGIPNVGKSTFINQLAGRAGTITADKPGVTRGRQWIKVGSDFDLLDTPGVLWPKFDDQQVGIRLACTGAISDNVLDKITLATHLLTLLTDIDPAIIEKRYRVTTASLAGAASATDESGTSNEVNVPGEINTPSEAALQLLTDIGNARGFKMKGGVIDLERTAIILIDEFRGGKLGRISLEWPE